MKEVALYDAKNGLSALIQEVEETGAEIIITRHGKPAARLAPVEPTLSQEQRQAALERLRTLQEKLALEGRGTEPVDWETVKREARNEDKDWLT